MEADPRIRVRAMQTAKQITHKAERGVGFYPGLKEQLNLARAYIELDAWASRMPDAGFTADSPRWDWWHERPR